MAGAKRSPHRENMVDKKRNGGACTEALSIYIAIDWDIFGGRTSTGLFVLSNNP